MQESKEGRKEKQSRRVRVASRRSARSLLGSFQSGGEVNRLDCLTEQETFLYLTCRPQAVSSFYSVIAGLRPPTPPLLL
jgi:hypothetical protein